MTDPAAAAVLSSVPQDLRASALALAAEGRFTEAIAAANRCNRISPDDELERLLLAWRRSAFAARPRTAPNPDWPASYPDPFPGVAGLPEIRGAQLTTDILAGAILHHGGLLVRGLVSADAAGKLAAGVDRALEGFTAWSADDTTPPTRWFSPAPRVGKIAFSRPWILGGGGAWAADSPHMLFELTELLEQTGVIDVVSGYLKERPVLSIGKTTLRKVPASLNSTDWHQDGAFLGPEVRSVNLWLALSECGRNASAIDLVPKRIPYIVETGTQGALFNWSVGQGVVDTVAQDAPVSSPEFAAGDALLFDHFFLHRTSLPPNRTQDRWAIESWMFAPSSYPVDQCPLML